MAAFMEMTKGRTNLGEQPEPGLHDTRVLLEPTNKQQETQGKCDASRNHRQAHEGPRGRFKSTRRQLDTETHEGGGQGSDRWRQDRSETAAGIRQNKNK